ncbi:MAG: hypothetical protein KKC18_14360 [Chloroflexi bacterium]|nr:hypothetical protein [Chloroflexota bacterium]
MSGIPSPPGFTPGFALGESVITEYRGHWSDRDDGKYAVHRYVILCGTCGTEHAITQPQINRVVRRGGGLVCDSCLTGIAKAWATRRAIEAGAVVHAIPVAQLDAVKGITSPITAERQYGIRHPTMATAHACRGHGVDL